jgi:uncharacterized membrane protein
VPALLTDIISYKNASFDRLAFFIIIVMNYSVTGTFCIGVTGATGAAVSVCQ